MANRQAAIARIILTGAVATVAMVAALARQPEPQRSSAPSTTAIKGPEVHPSAPPRSRPRHDTLAVAPPAAGSPFVVRRVLAMGGPITFGDYLWDDEGVPAGPLVITVDVAAQTLSVFRDGYEIGATAILYGADEKPTPLGTFPITQKDAHHFSRTYDNAPMPYSLRLTGDGVFIHGSKVEWGYATHGCVGVPVAFARKLFAVASVGDRVIITRGKFLRPGQPITS